METAEGFLTQGGFLFPILKTQEIVDIMAELNVEITKAELIEPQRHKEKIRQLFVLLLDICQGQSEEDWKPTMAMHEYIQEHALFPALHSEAGDLLFYLAVRDLLQICGFDQFSWKDLYQPTTKRLRYQLSAIINLAKFREDQLRVYAELNEPVSDKV
jgi:kinetochore protein Nuf2